MWHALLFRLLITIFISLNKNKTRGQNKTDSMSCSPLSTYLHDLQEQIGALAFHLHSDNAKGCNERFILPTCCIAPTRWDSSPSLKNGKASLKGSENREPHLAPNATSLIVVRGRGPVTTKNDLPVVRPRRRLSRDLCVNSAYLASSRSCQYEEEQTKQVSKQYHHPTRSHNNTITASSSRSRRLSAKAA